MDFAGQHKYSTSAAYRCVERRQTKCIMIGFGHVEMVLSSGHLLLVLKSKNCLPPRMKGFASRDKFEHSAAPVMTPILFRLIIQCFLSKSRQYFIQCNILLHISQLLREPLRLPGPSGYVMLCYVFYLVQKLQK